MPPSVDSAARSGLSRRSFFRLAGGASALAGLPILTEAQLALAQLPKFADSSKGIHIDANENPMGPSEAARQAMIDMIPRGGRYLFDREDDLAETFARIEGLHPDTVMPYPGSSEPLHLTVLAFTSKSRPLVIADPGYEAPIWAAEVSGAPVIKVPLADPKGAAMHDIKAMIAASPNAGVIYICNPNNPTGTSTPREQIEYAVANAPKGAVLLIDEAYIHLSDAPSTLDFVKQGKDVIVLRTFSKLYGMAGIRMGLAIARPDLLKKVGSLAGLNPLPITAVAARQGQPARQGAGPHAQKDHRRYPPRDSGLAREPGLSVHSVGDQLLYARRPPARQGSDCRHGRKGDVHWPRLARMADSCAHHGGHERRNAGLPQGARRGDEQFHRGNGSAGVAKETRGARICPALLKAASTTATPGRRRVIPGIPAPRSAPSSRRSRDERRLPVSPPRVAGCGILRPLHSTRAPSSNRAEAAKT